MLFLQVFASRICLALGTVDYVTCLLSLSFSVRLCMMLTLIVD